MVFANGSIAEYSDTEEILEAVPESKPFNSSSLLPYWITDGCNATLFLSSMSKPHHWKLCQNTSQQWIFCPGNLSDISKGILLDDLSASAHQLLDTGQLFKGHTKFPCMYQTRTHVQLRDSILRHVSAHGLHSLIAPTSLLAHQNMNDSDKTIWDAAYDEEFDGLSLLPTWEVLTKQQFKSLSKGVKALPSMAIATIKYDTFNRPKRAKYRIIVLGNHDCRTWSKESTAAPVISQLELQLLTSLAISQRCVLKNCDIKQAFCPIIST